MRRASGRLSEALQCFLLGVEHIEQVVDVHDAERLSEIRMHVAERDPSAASDRGLLTRHQMAETVTVKRLDRGKVQHNTCTPLRKQCTDVIRDISADLPQTLQTDLQHLH